MATINNWNGFLKEKCEMLAPSVCIFQIPRELLRLNVVSICCLSSDSFPDTLFIHMDSTSSWLWCVTPCEVNSDERAAWSSACQVQLFKPDSYNWIKSPDCLQTTIHLKKLIFISSWFTWISIRKRQHPLGRCYSFTLWEISLHEDIYIMVVQS